MECKVLAVGSVAGSLGIAPISAEIAGSAAGIARDRSRCVLGSLRDRSGSLAACDFFKMCSETLFKGESMVFAGHSSSRVGDVTAHRVGVSFAPLGGLHNQDG